MIKSDGERFRNLMLGMADNFCDTISAAGMRLRWELLCQYSIDQVERAGFDIMRSRKYTKMPTIAEFIESIDGNKDDIAEAQAHHVLSQVRKKGSYQSPVFDDPVTSELVAKRWTWSALCSMPDRDQQWFVKEFVNAYRAYDRLNVVAQLNGNKALKQLTAGMVNDVAGPS